MSFNSNGILTTKLPQGSDNDNYQLYVTVLIKDESNGVSRFDFNHSIQVWPDQNLKNELIMALVNKDITSDFYNSLSSGNLKAVASNILGLISMLNVRPNISNSSVKKYIIKLNNYYKITLNVSILFNVGQCYSRSC